MLKNEDIKKICEDILREIVHRHHITIIELSVMPDYIHMVVSRPTTMCVFKAFHLLKGASSHEIFQQIPVFRKRYPRGAFWSLGQFYRTIGDADAETVIYYV